MTLLLSQAIASAFIIAAVPHLDEELLQEVRELVQDGGQQARYPSLLEALEKRAKAALTRPKSAKDSSLDRWRHQVRAIVQRVVQPDNLDWMEDDADDAPPDTALIHRALEDIATRYEKE